MTFLKKSVDALQNKLQREQAEHERNRKSVMEINLNLIKDIEFLKKEKEERVKEFNKLGGIKEYKSITEALKNREKNREEQERFW